MRIVYLGNFDRFFKTEKYIAYALTKLGHKVTTIQVDNRTRPKQIENLINHFDPDLLLTSKPDTPTVINICRYANHKNIKTAAWAFDLFLDFPGGRVMPKHFVECDHVFTTDGGHNDKWEALGINHHVLRQGIHEPDAYIHPSETVGTSDDPYDKPFDVLFFGDLSNSPCREFRRNLIEAVQNRFGNRFVRHSQIRGPALNQAIGTTHIVLGESVPSPHYWSNRIYEITGRGGFFIHPHTVGLEEEFTMGQHYAAYEHGNVDSAMAVIEEFLKEENREWRQNILEAGHEKTKTEYTYTKRCEQLIETIFPSV